jgi:hypothetical protein
MSAHLIFVLLAFLSFVLATAEKPGERFVARVDLTALGLAFWVFAELLGGLHG